ncbi:MAG TPA: hypothetical protein VGS27_31910 [Candidatus Sulfotelmatobacter sp.]|nr:hypothetical protein [Candidatus Sulfotelmatobacter sp.]
MGNFLHRKLLTTVGAVLVGTITLSAQTSQIAATPSPEEVEIAALSLPSAPDVDMNPPVAFVPATPAVEIDVPRRASEAHPFWDRENRVLFSLAAAAATSDFFVTHANLQSGGRELNPLTRPFAGSTPALATNFALETAGVIGMSYLFHKTGHHKLERLTSFANIGASGVAVGYGLSHR